MSIIKILLIAVCGCIALALLKNVNSSYIIIVEIALVIMVFVSALPEFKELFSLLKDLPFIESTGKESITVLLKVFSLLFAGSIVGDICRDNGENAVAGAVETAVKIISIVVAMPVLSAVMGVALSFMGN